MSIFQTAALLQLLQHRLALFISGQSWGPDCHACLQECRETLVGDNAVRGISGGQKKRVTTGGAAFGKPLCKTDNPQL